MFKMMLLSALVLAQSSRSIKLIDSERVRPEEVMIFTRSKLIEEGPSIARMSGHTENINTVRYNMNTYRVGYSLKSEKVDGRHVFTGPVKCWRATSTQSVSEWPDSKYPASRNETIRRAMLLQPITIQQSRSIDSVIMEQNLRLYYLPSLVGHDGKQYQTKPTAIAFFIHPKTRNRMTVMIREDHVYGSVNRPLSATSGIYVKDTKSYSAGPFGLGTAYVPYVFYSKQVQFDVEPFAENNPFNNLMKSAIEAINNQEQLSYQDFKKIYHEMTRYTGGM